MVLSFSMVLDMLCAVLHGYRCVASVHLGRLTVSVVRSNFLNRDCH